MSTTSSAGSSTTTSSSRARRRRGLAWARSPAWRPWPMRREEAAMDATFDLAPPLGFEPHDRKSPLTDPWEPLYSRKTARAVVLGLRAGPQHTNSRGFVHGGLIGALADNAMGLSCGRVSPHLT